MARRPLQVQEEVWSALKKLAVCYDTSISEIIRSMLKNGGEEILKKDASLKMPKYADVKKAIANL